MHPTWIGKVLDFLLTPTIDSRVNFSSKEQKRRSNEQLAFCVNCDATRIIDRFGRCVNCGSGSILQEGAVKKFEGIKRASRLSKGRSKITLVYSREVKIK